VKATRAICIVTLAAGLNAPPAPSQDLRDRVWTFYTDSSWRVTDRQPPAGWHNEVELDESGGGWVFAVREPGNAIWHTSIDSGQAPDRIWFRRVFALDELDAAPARLRVTAHFDDDGQVILNGTVIVDDGGGGATTISKEIDPALLKPGLNLLAGRAVDTFGVANRAYVALEAHVEPSAPRTVIVPFGSTWKYLDDGSDQGEAWRMPGFEDSAWLQGPAELGYGDGDEGTVVGFGGDVQRKHVTTYFRHAFELVDSSRFGAYRLGLRRDDGAAVYFNGEDIARSNLATGALFDRLADGDATDEGKATFHFVVPAVRVAAGANLLAAEVHQVVPTSTDISFDLTLEGFEAKDLPRPAPLPAAARFDGLEPGTQSAAGSPPGLGFRAAGCLSGLFNGVNEAGEYEAHASQCTFALLFDEVDVRGLDGARAALDVRAEEVSATSDFEAEDFLRVSVRLFRDGVEAGSVVLLDARGSGNPADDSLKALDRSGEAQRFTRIEAKLPGGYTTAQLLVEGNVDSASERLFADNIEILPPAGSRFRRGDVDANGQLGIGDAVLIFRSLFLTGEPFACADAADADDLGTVVLTDGIYILRWLFLDGAPLPAPAEPCGPDPTLDSIVCDLFPACE